ncbi:oligosaccharide flippase family protein [Mesorhizobium escarrei]|uniref:Lipopolysaccharide biosynthesis protein n=1 Tax=Mesorhizobium escarrei TaxID=666018 RepID=A0ABN8K862_9HYPH|nr:oligosaccharide flippase family protein [Mesorhizobium escarrei]CAH2406466.1 membrane hypothetical protein [Mesorhizobium escarrei]
MTGKNRGKSSGVASFSWTAGQSWFGVIVQIGLMIGLSRLVSPHEFGIYALVLAPVSLLATFSQLGLGPGIVRSKHDEDRTAATASFIALISSVVCTSCMLLVVTRYASFSGSGDQLHIARWLLIIVLVAPFQAVLRGLLQKDQRFEAIAKIEIGSLILNVVVSLVSALAGFGVWALVGGQITYQLATLFCSWITTRPKIAYHRQEAKDLLLFSWSYVWLKMIDTAAMTLDRLVVGWVAGTAAVGFYQRASNIRTIAGNLILTPMDVFSFPRLSGAKDIKAVGREFGNTKIITFLFSAPLSIFIIICGGEWTPIVFGKAWEPAGILIQIMAAVLPFRGLDRANAILARSAGRQGVRIALQLVMLALSLLSLFMFAPVSLERATVCVSVVMIAMVVPGAWLTASILGRSLSGELRETVPCLMLWGGCSAGGLLINVALQQLLPPWMSALASACLASGAFVVPTFLFPGLFFSETSVALVEKYRILVGARFFHRR